MRILVIDDNEPSRRLMTYLLEAFGHSVSAASNGGDGLAQIRRAPPERVLLDVQMPGMTGYDVLREVRADPSISGTRLIAITAGGARLGRTLITAGFDGFLEKPIDVETFADSVVRIPVPADVGADTGARAAESRAEPTSPQHPVPETDITVDPSRIGDGILERAAIGFIGAMEHDLVTPLATTLGFATLLREGRAGTLTMPQLSAARDLVASTERLAEMIRQLFAVADAASCRPRPPIDLDTIGAHVAAAVRSRASECGVQIAVRTARGLGAPEVSSGGRLMAVLYGIVSALVERVARNGCIRLTVVRRGEHAAFEVHAAPVPSRDDVLSRLRELGMLDGAEPAGAEAGQAITLTVIANPA